MLPNSILQMLTVLVVRSDRFVSATSSPTPSKQAGQSGHPHKAKDTHSFGARASHSRCTQRRFHSQYTAMSARPHARLQAYMHAFCEHQACLSKQRLDAFMHAFIPPWSGRSSPQYYNTKYCTRRRQHHSISKRFSVCLRDYPYLQVYKYMIYARTVRRRGVCECVPSRCCTHACVCVVCVWYVCCVLCMYGRRSILCF